VFGSRHHLQQLFSAVELGCHVRSGAGTDVAVDTRHLGVRRDLIGRELGRHDMASGPAELHGIHVFNGGVRQVSSDYYVQHGGYGQEEDQVAELNVVPSKLRKLCRGDDLPFVEPNAERNQCQAQEEDCGQQEYCQQSEIRVARPGQIRG
jgi:hypothetical protein